MSILALLKTHEYGDRVYSIDQKLLYHGSYLS